MAKKNGKKSPDVKKGPRQQRLLEMDDPKIAVLEDKALEYAEVRDQRIGLSQKEGEFKKQLLQLMKAQKREHYQHGNIKIDIVHEQENIKVKVKSGGDDEGEEE
jgi:hypothetical protein